MPNTTKIKLDEISGEHFPDLATAQSEAKPHIARALVASMRGMLTDGLLVIRDGKIIPSEK